LPAKGRGRPRTTLLRSVVNALFFMAQSGCQFEIIPADQQNPGALRALQEADIKKWWPLIKEFGIKGE
jgi:transposase